MIHAKWGFTLNPRVRRMVSSAGYTRETVAVCKIACKVMGQAWQNTCENSVGFQDYSVIASTKCVAIYVITYGKDVDCFATLAMTVGSLHNNMRSLRNGMWFLHNDMWSLSLSKGVMTRNRTRNDIQLSNIFMALRSYN